MNVRKFICKELKPKVGGWLYRAADCKRYEPKPIPPVPPNPTIPNPPGPPYFGTSDYALVTRKTEDIVWFINNLRANGGNMTEVFFVFTWDNGWSFAPYQIVDYRPDIGSAYGDYKFPVFDLDKWDEGVWNKWRQIFGLCRDAGITLSVRIMDQCSLKYGFEKRHNPFRSNVQRLDNGVLTGGLYGVQIKEWYQRLISRLVKELKSVGVDFFINPWNEFDVILDGWTEDEGNQVARDSLLWWTNAIAGAGCPADRILVSTSREFDWAKSLGYRMEIHGVASPETMLASYARYGDNIFPNGDGPDYMAEGRPSFNNYREPSVEQGVEMGRIIREDKSFGYCHFNRAIESQKPPDIRRAQFDVVAALAGE